MSRRGVWLGVVLLAALSFGLGLLLDVQATPAASALSLSARGLFLARRYLEERGLVVGLLDHSFDQGAPQQILVLAFPWQRWVASDEQVGLGRHLRRKGTVLFAYSGEGESKQEADVARWLGLEWEKLRSPPPLSPFAWVEFANEEWTLAATDEWVSKRPVAPLSVRAFSLAPRAPASAEVWYRDAHGKPVVFTYSYLGGQVLALPAGVLSNAHILNEGNADFLESLARSLAGAWSFDEYHHGLSMPITAAQKRPRMALDLLLVHLGLLYLLVVFRLSRRFGPMWPEKPVVSGSTRTFLLGLGALHDELGHHREAARLLGSRARELQPRLGFGEGGTAMTGPELVEMARAVGEAQNG